MHERDQDTLKGAKTMEPHPKYLFFQASQPISQFGLICCSNKSGQTKFGLKHCSNKTGQTDFGLVLLILLSHFLLLDCLHVHIWHRYFEKKSDLACIFWQYTPLKQKSATPQGLPPPTQQIEIPI